MPFLREELSPDDRALPLLHTIDAGFVNRRAIETVIGPNGMQIVDDALRALPPLPEGLLRVRIDKIYADVALTFCKILPAPALREVIVASRGRIFCSTEALAPCADVYEAERTHSDVIVLGETEYDVRLEYSTAHISSDTLRMELNKGAELSVIATLNRKVGRLLVFRPLVIGAPWLRSDNPKVDDYAMWWGHDFYEHWIEDFDEFARVVEQPTPDHIEPMRTVSEKAFKACLGVILGESVSKDWGGETSDHFTAHIHLRGKRTSGAFLLKGPAHFAPMTLNHLGKNNDQIYRLAQEPAEVLIVQHCHDISPAVRATLRAFAVQPSRPRRYCLVDGRDSLRLLRAYGLYDRAVELSREAAPNSPD